MIRAAIWLRISAGAFKVSEWLNALGEWAYRRWRRAMGLGREK
jgi:hypothetical protein